jgi:DNA repair exonuclease SbcCD ATPase subunit
MNSLRAAWNAWNGDSGRREELRAVVRTTSVVLSKKERLIDAADAYSKSWSRDKWADVQQALKSTNSALEELRKEIEDVIQRHSRDTTTSQLQELEQFIDNKLKTLCGIPVVEPSSDKRPGFSDLVKTMKKEKADIKNAKDDLDRLIPNQSGDHS